MPPVPSSRRDASSVPATDERVGWGGVGHRPPRYPVRRRVPVRQPPGGRGHDLDVVAGCRRRWPPRCCAARPRRSRPRPRPWATRTGPPPGRPRWCPGARSVGVAVDRRRGSRRHRRLGEPVGPERVERARARARPRRPGRPAAGPPRPPWPGPGGCRCGSARWPPAARRPGSARRWARCRASRAGGPGVTSTTEYSSRAGTTRRASSTRSASAAEGHVEGEAALLDGGAEHQAPVVPRDEVAGPPVDEGPHGAPQAGHAVGCAPGGRSPRGPAGPAGARPRARRRAPPERLPAATTTTSDATGVRRRPGPRPAPVRRPPPPGRPGRPRGRPRWTGRPSSRARATARLSTWWSAGRSTPPLTPGASSGSASRQARCPEADGRQAHGRGGRRAPGRSRPGPTDRRPPPGCRRRGSGPGVPRRRFEVAGEPRPGPAGGQVEEGEVLLAEVRPRPPAPACRRRPRWRPARAPGSTRATDRPGGGGPPGDGQADDPGPDDHHVVAAVRGHRAAAPRDRDVPWRHATAAGPGRAGSRTRRSEARIGPAAEVEWTARMTVYSCRTTQGPTSSRAGRSTSSSGATR